jgi:hypothetical protein
MATATEKKLAIQLLTERLERVTGKKVVLKKISQLWVEQLMNYW